MGRGRLLISPIRGRAGSGGRVIFSFLLGDAPGQRSTSRHADKLLRLGPAHRWRRRRNTLAAELSATFWRRPASTVEVGASNWARCCSAVLLGRRTNGRSLDFVCWIIFFKGKKVSPNVTEVGSHTRRGSRVLPPLRQRPTAPLLSNEIHRRGHTAPFSSASLETFYPRLFFCATGGEDGGRWKEELEPKKEKSGRSFKYRSPSGPLKVHETWSYPRCSAEQ